MDSGIRTVLKKVFISKFRAAYSDWQIPGESQEVTRPKHCNNNKDGDIRPTANNGNDEIVYCGVLR